MDFDLGAFAAQTVLVQQAEAGQNDAVLIGVVKDASTGQGVEGAVVVITGEKLQGERVRTTDISGLYRIPTLPPGTYELTVIHKDYAQGQKRTGLKLQAGQTIRFDTSLVPSGAKDSVTIIVESPTVDVVSSGTGMTIDKEMSRRVPIAVPTGKGGANINNHNEILWFKGTDCIMFFMNITKSMLKFLLPNNQYLMNLNSK